MMKFALSVFCAAAMIFASAVNLHADEGDGLGVAVGGKVGTLGLGGDVSLRLHERLNLRGTVNWLKLDVDRQVDDIDFTMGVDFSAFGGFVDVHPFANHFRVSAGLFFGSNSTSLDATPSESEEIGDHTYTPEQIGTLSGKIKFEKEPAPYIGIGYGNAVATSQNFSFVFDLGVVFQTYEAELSASGLAAQDPQFRNDLEKLRQDVQDELDSVKIYPVLMFGMAYQF